jgi:hypothetical protein
VALLEIVYSGMILRFQAELSVPLQYILILCCIPHLLEGPFQVAVVSELFKVSPVSSHSYVRTGKLCNLSEISS